MPKYKYVKKLVLTDEELVKTTTLKIKRNVEMKKIMENNWFCNKIVTILSQKCKEKFAEISCSFWASVV